ncbi:unnamed protein product [Litomosoides sigmodontis]|uniref:Uncharacterized protein n=1 Tax=Litomosoides sigmodontis TaxID=42156 RepID=A0A3P6T8P0_LITSI|nr:unnamed protein product [Litomosoides sigmodontis]
MEEIDKTSSASASPRSIHSYHRGNGTLRGGGVQKVYHNGPTFKAYKRKLDHRLGYCIVGCLVTIGIVLTIFGSFHETAHEELIHNDVEEILLDDDDDGDGDGDGGGANVDDRGDNDDDWLHENSFSNETAAPMKMMVGKTHLANHIDDELAADNMSDEKILSIPYSEPDTCFGSEDVNQERCLVASELDDYYNTLFKLNRHPKCPTSFDQLCSAGGKSHIALWNLTTVNIIVAIFLSPFTFMFNSEIVKNVYYKLFYRVILFLVLFFMASQLIVLINPLLYSSFMYPTIVDKLFIEKLPRVKELISRVEFRFACQFDYISQLVELNLQQPCIPRIKNVLLLPYAVVLLIIIDLLPFLFIIFTYAWDRWLKDSAFCSFARSRIELNNQRRPQSREDILKKTMEGPHYV